MPRRREDDRGCALRRRCHGLGEPVQFSVCVAHANHALEAARAATKHSANTVDKLPRPSPPAARVVRTLEVVRNVARSYGQRSGSDQQAISRDSAASRLVKDVNLQVRIVPDFDRLPAVRGEVVAAAVQTAEGRRRVGRGPPRRKRGRKDRECGPRIVRKKKFC